MITILDAPISILIADASNEFSQLLTDYVDKENDMFIAGKTGDGEEALKLVRQLHPDVMIADIMLKNLGAAEVIRELRENGELPRTIVMSAFFNDEVAAEMSGMGVNYCYAKPCRIPEVIQRVRECASDLERRLVAKGKYDGEIGEALAAFSLMPHLEGYRYVNEGLRQTIADPTVLHGITKVLYPELARKFGTTPQCIEHSIRNALDISWRKGLSDKPSHKFYRDAYSKLDRRPSNSKFLALAAELVVTRYKTVLKENTAKRE